MTRITGLRIARNRRIWQIVVLPLLLTLLFPFTSGAALQAGPPGAEAVFQLPFADPPGPSTWLLGQSYGNTTGAYRQRRQFYEAGQGLHFGLDLVAPCGYPVVAIGDGVVAHVDVMGYGSAPHNLMIDHPNGYASFYGHLLKRPPVRRGQAVRAGEVVALVGDPDKTCKSRPHLHLEIRNASAYDRAFNPILLIKADWDALALVGSFGAGYARDLDDPRRWQTMYDQPEINFWGPMLNDYDHPWPPAWTP